MKKLINQSGHFEDAVKFNWQPMELLENGRCLFGSITDNPSKCVLDILQFAHVETGEISELYVTIGFFSFFFRFKIRSEVLKSLC